MRIVVGGSPAYLQARLQARLGDYPDPADWQRLAAFAGPGPLLQGLATSGLRPWVRGLTLETPVHELEALLRARLVEHIHEVAAWSPPSWRPPLDWLAELPALPARRLLAAAQAPALAFGDTQFEALRQRPEAQRLQALLSPGLEDLGAALSGPRAGDWMAAWEAGWRRRLGPLPAAQGRPALALAQWLRARLNAAPATAEEDWIRALEPGLRRGFRRHAPGLAAALAYLALTALQLARLRGLLVDRLLFGAPEAGPA